MQTQITDSIMKLPSKLHISEAEHLSKELNTLLQSPDAIVIDISEVEAVDTASIQVLCALQKSLNATDNNISWIGTSKAFNEAADMLGVADFLKLKE